MKIEILKEILIKNSSKERFAVLTNIKNGNMKSKIITFFTIFPISCKILDKS